VAFAKFGQLQIQHSDFGFGFGNSQSARAFLETFKLGAMTCMGIYGCNEHGWHDEVGAT
jgi:hypothetical protein